MTESVPFAAQEYVDGYAAIALPPPGIGQFQKHQFILQVSNVAKVVDGGNSVVPVLNYAHIFHVGIQAQRDKGVFFCQFSKDVVAHKYCSRILCIPPQHTYTNKLPKYY